MPTPGKDQRPSSDVLFLSGWWLSPTPLKNMLVSWDDELPPNIWNNKKCSKPPTSVVLILGCLEGSP